MTEYNETVNKQRIMLEAEEWANGVKTVHAHHLSSMWYDNRPQDTFDSGVTDVEYNDGRVERTLNNGRKIDMNPPMSKEDLYRAFCRR